MKFSYSALRPFRGYYEASRIDDPATLSQTPGRSTAASSINASGAGDCGAMRLGRSPSRGWADSSIT
jgi:hypothetical protein